LLGRWFTRGWTLQELLAPERVEFFNKTWDPLGSKEILAPYISEITTIPERFIKADQRSKARHPSIAQRMSWAAGRETTRLEDKAYSLLGLFNVNMPLLYGEGAKAFIRLQEEILKNSADHSLFAWNPLSGLCGVLADSPDLFRHCGNIIPLISKAEAPRPYSMTNLGLNIELRLLPTVDNDSIALLDCQYEDDFSGCLGIKLRETSVPSVFCRMRTFKPKFTAEEMASATIRRIYIEKVHHSETHSWIRIMPYILQSVTVTRHGWKLSDVASRDSSGSKATWNAQTEVLSMPIFNHPLHFDPLHFAAFEFRHPEEKLSFVVWFAVHEVRPVKPVVQVTIKLDTDTLDDWLTFRVEHWYSNTMRQQFLDQSELPQNFKVKAELKEEEMLNQKVTVVDVQMHHHRVHHINVFELDSSGFEVDGIAKDLNGAIL
jgi:hypothetical protein